MLARHYQFLIDTVLLNYPFKSGAMGAIIWQMYILCALANFYHFLGLEVKGLITAIFVQEKLLSVHGIAICGEETSDWWQQLGVANSIVLRFRS